MNLDDKSLQILSCNTSIRPKDAAGIEEILPHLQNFKVDKNSAITEFHKAGLGALQAFTEAERRCCTDLTWELEITEDLLRLTITGTPEQVSVIKTWFGGPT
jgi:hypothetical protein